MSLPKLARLIPQPEGTQHDEVAHVSTFAFIRNGGKILLIRRARPERQAGKWVIPGALLSFGEDPTSAARRVVMEQVGATVSKLKLLDIQSYGDKHWDLCFVYEAEIPGIGMLGADFDKAEYFEPAQAPQELREDHNEVIQMARSRLFL